MTKQEVRDICDALPEKGRGKRGRTAGSQRRSHALLAMRLGGSTLEEIGVKYGFSRKRARQIVEDAVGRLPEKERNLAEEHIRVICGQGDYSKNAARGRRRDVRDQLRILFENKGYRRAAVLRILSGKVNSSASDSDLRQYIYENYNIKRFGDWLRCPGCEQILSRYDEFSPAIASGTSQTAYCRSCNTARRNANYHKSPNVRLYCRDYQRRNKNRQYIYIRRWRANKDGVAPLPLPPAGVRDEDIVVERLPRGGVNGGWANYWASMNPKQRRKFIAKITAARMAAREKRLGAAC